MAKLFMIARHTEVLRNTKDHSKGFMTNEAFSMSGNLKKKDYAEASIILDIANQKIVKSRFPERSFEDLFKYFTTHYSKYINTWLKENSNE
jgi:hypothetical protein